MSWATLPNSPLRRCILLLTGSLSERLYVRQELVLGEMTEVVDDGIGSDGGSRLGLAVV
jgi:hypothetical protein